MVTLEQILEAIQNYTFEYSNDQIEIENDYWLDYDFIIDEVHDITGLTTYDVDFSIKTDGEEKRIPKQWKTEIENKLIEKYS